MELLNELNDNDNMVKLLNNPIHDGIEYVIKLLFKYNACKLNDVFICTGIGPVNALYDKSNNVKLHKSPIEVGIEPFRSALLLNINPFNSGSKAGNSSGIVPFKFILVKFTSIIMHIDVILSLQPTLHITPSHSSKHGFTVGEVKFQCPTGVLHDQFQPFVSLYSISRPDNSFEGTLLLCAILLL